MFKKVIRVSKAKREEIAIRVVKLEDLTKADLEELGAIKSPRRSVFLDKSKSEERG